MNLFPRKQRVSQLELIHSDVCGPLDVPSVGESRHFVTIIDDFSRHNTVYMIKQKYEVLTEFVNLVKAELD